MGKSFVPPASLLAFIREHDKFIVAGHEEPDADCIGSQLVVASMLERLGKKVLLRSSGPFRKTEVIPYEKLFSNSLSKADKEGAVAIVVDCSSPERTGRIGKALAGLSLAVIDHHAVGKKEDGEECAYVEPYAPSTTVLILSIFEALALELTKDEARLLFLGLCTDTGFFRHVDTNGEAVFSVATKLAAAGASPKEAFNVINGGKTLSSRRLLGLVLGRAESFFDGKLLISWEEFDETEKYGVKNRDSDTLYQLLMSVGGVEAVAVIRQSLPEQCAIGLRSRDAVDVAKIAAVFGGGGHKNAAGVYIKGRIADLRPRVVSEFEKVLLDVPPE
jgi:phosphoesterase RecJ-like protein